MFRSASRLGKIGKNRGTSRHSVVMRDCRLPVETLETRFLLSSTASAAVVPPAPSLVQQSSVRISVESSSTPDSAFVPFVSNGVVIFATDPAEYGHGYGMTGHARPAMDAGADGDRGLINHFAFGEGIGAPEHEGFGHDRPDMVLGKFDSSKDMRVSTAGEMSDRDMPPHPPQYIVGAGNPYQVTEIVIVAPQSTPAADGTRSYSTPTRPDVSPAEVTQQQKVPSREVRGGTGNGGDFVRGHAPDAVIATAQTQSVMTAAAVRDNGVVHTVLDSAMTDARALMQAATPIVEAARVAPGVFATAVVTNVERESSAVIATPVAAMRMFGSSQIGEASDAVRDVAAAGENSGAIVVAHALLRLLRDFAGPGTSAAAVDSDTSAVDGDGSTLEARSNWDVPVFMSANLLGLAPGSPWMTTVQASGQRTLRWVAGVSLLITVAGCYYCAVTTARARRAALDEGLDNTLQFTL